MLIPRIVVPDVEKRTPMPEQVLPKVTKDEMSRLLPADPTKLLTDAQRKELEDDLARLARLRRDAEATSGSLRLA